MKSFISGNNYAEHSALRPSKYNVRDPAEAFAVEQVHRFFPFQFAVTRFHTLSYAELRRNVPIYEISFRMLPSAFFSRRETCACEIPTSAEISVCVFPSK